MQKYTTDYDNVFKTMKSKHKRLFLSVINDTFGKNYPMDTKIEILPSEGYLTESETTEGSRDIVERISDFVIKIETEVYLLECQSYDDGSMAIRIAEYAFIVARQFATWDIGHATIPMPGFSVIYIKKTKRTPKTTTVTFLFPDGQSVDYESENIILEELSKEYIIEKQLFPYIPFYIARYEKAITSTNQIEHVEKDLEYFRNEMVRLHKKKEILDEELVDMKGFVNTIITHITNGNENEERLVSIMGGNIIETESEKLIRQGKAEGILVGEARGKVEGKAEGKAQMLIMLGQEDGLDEATILQRLQEKAGLTLEQATAYFKQYGI